MDTSEHGEEPDDGQARRRPAGPRAPKASPGRSGSPSAGPSRSLSSDRTAAELSQFEAEEARHAADEEFRRPGDRQLLSRLRETWFSGREYESFANDLARYALPVLCAWMYSGYIFVLTAKDSHSLVPSDAELHHLRCDPELREELAIMTVAKALRAFRERVLLVDGWIEEGGASLTTYFTGCCVLEFPNEFRAHRRTQKRWREQDASERRGLTTAAAETQDPAGAVAGNLWTADCLAELDPRTRAVVELRMDGYSHAEIVEMLGETSTRAVEGVLHRLRNSQWARKKRKDER